MGSNMSNTNESDVRDNRSYHNHPARKIPPSTQTIDLPGQLSKSGARHDNDSHLIANIQILPTKDELLCKRVSYIPVNDPAARHFLDGPARLCDIHFRLLREDLIQLIRTEIKAIFSKVQKNIPIPKAFDHSVRTSTFSYFNVTVESARCDKMKGIVFRLRFRQPTKFQSQKKRIKYWEDIRSLERESLLCLVSDEPDLKGFLLVEEKNKKLLGTDENWSWINVTVADGNKLVQEYLLSSLSDHNSAKYSLVLVEFPRILLVVYKSVLESLQARSGEVSFPFSKYLVPTMTQRQQLTLCNNILSVNPPSYAPRSFRYDLKPLKKHRHSALGLFIHSDPTLNNTDSITKLTSLDAGQSKGLVAALTQEFALIQGVTHSIVMLMKKVHQARGKHISEFRSLKHCSITKRL
jgi:hypothetical protein